MDLLDLRPDFLYNSYMTRDLIIIGSGVLLIVVVALLWAWNHLRSKKQQLLALEKALSETLYERRAVMPYLIESYWGVKGKGSDKTLNTLIEHRGKARHAKTFQELWAEEQQINTLLDVFLQSVAGDPTLEADIGWLEARTDIHKAHEAIAETEKQYAILNEFLKTKRQHFPFSLFLR